MNIKTFAIFCLCITLASCTSEEQKEQVKKVAKRQIPFMPDGTFMDYAAYDYYDWVCDANGCQICDVLTGACCNPNNPNCFLPDSCLNNPCLSGGTCISTRTIDNRPDFVCVCQRGLTGKYCQLIDEFTPALVAPIPIPVPGPVGGPEPAPQQGGYQAPQQGYQAPQQGYGAQQGGQFGPQQGGQFGAQQQGSQLQQAQGRLGNGPFIPPTMQAGMQQQPGMGGMQQGMGAMGGMGMGGMNQMSRMGGMGGAGMMGGMGGMGAAGMMGGMGGMGGAGMMGGMGGMMGGMGGFGK